MHQMLFSIPAFALFGHVVGPIHFYSYGLCLALGLGVSIYLFARDTGKYISPKIGLTYDQAFQKTFDLGMWVVICSILGARAFYVFENYPEFQNGNWPEAFYIWQGGLVFYGGLFGAIAVAFYWFKLEKWPMAISFDLVAPYILLGHAFGRVGCYLNGCCYGIVDQDHGVIFPSVGDNLPHLPTQLWELYGDLALFVILLWVRRWTIHFSWLSISLYGLTYGILRYVIEIWRLDRGVHFLIAFRSVSQAVSGILVVLSISVIAWILLKHRKSAGTPKLG